MATTKEYKEFILEQLSLLDNIVCRPMMGEYLLYYKGVLFGGIYDDRFLVKMLDTNKKYSMKEAIPYEGAKPMYLVDDVDNKELLMYLVDDVDNKELLKSIVIDTCEYYGIR